MTAGDICVREVVVVEADEALTTAARLMRSERVGDVVVVERHADCNVPVGILTDRDIVVGPVANTPHSLAELKVGDVATMDLTTLSDEDDILAAIEAMRSKGVRRLPVVDSRGGLVGIVAYDDLVEELGREIAELGRLSGLSRRREAKAQPPRP